MMPTPLFWPMPCVSWVASLVPLGIVGDDHEALAAVLDRGLASADMVLLSGGTSKGSGDVSFRVLARRSPGIVVHGVALKPGKPICLGAVGGTPVAILPGFPTSAIFTFHEFIAPVLQVLAGRHEAPRVRSRPASPSDATASGDVPSICWLPSCQAQEDVG